MTDKFKTLIKEFKRIEKMGYVKSVNKCSNGVGMTFEYLLGKEPDDFSYPDYDGIEIKTQNAGTNYPLTLFSCAPQGSIFPKLDDLRSKYGYFHYYPNELKRLNLEFFYDKNILITNRYFFNLEIDKDEQRIYLLVYDIRHNLIERDAYWTFDDLKEKFETKLKYLGYIFARGNRDAEGNEVFKYIKLECYVYKNFETFLSLIEKNIISIGITTEDTKYGPNKGKPKCGCYFKIGKHDLRKLFELKHEVGLEKQNYL